MKNSTLKKLMIAPIVLSLVSISACSTIKNVNLPFGKKEAERTKDDGRITILSNDEEVKIDETLAAAGAITPPALPVASWPNVAGPLNTKVENVSGDGALSILWKRKIGAGASNSQALIAQPLIADGKIFAVDSHMIIRAFSADSRKELWQTNLNQVSKSGWLKPASRAIAGGIGYDNGVIVASSGFGQIIGVNAEDGKVKWRFNADSPVHAAPLVANNRAYVVSSNSQIYALDTQNGEMIWTQSGASESARILSASSSTILGDTLVTPYASGDIVASFVANGRRLWNENLSRVGSTNSLSTINDIAGHPVINDGIVYAVSQSGLLAAIDFRSGSKIWDKSIPSIQSPWVAGNYVYVVSVDAELYCVEKTEGSIVWKTTLRKYKNEKKRKGRIVWTGPVMIEGKLVLASSEGAIIEVDAKDGKVAKTIKGGKEFLIPPSVADGTIYFLDNNGDLVALK